MTIYRGIYPKLPLAVFTYAFFQFNLAVFSSAPANALDLTMVFLGLFGFFMHFQYCGYCIKRRIEPPRGALTVSILFIPVVIFSFGQAYRGVGLEIPNDRFDYIYFSAVTFTTLGYGDILPNNLSVRIITVVEAVIGYIMIPLIIGQMLWTWNSAIPKRGTR